MTYTEFVDWCNDRVEDGCWSGTAAILCMNIIDTLNKYSELEREEEWNDISKKIIELIIEPTNELIKNRKDVKKKESKFNFLSKIKRLFA